MHSKNLHFAALIALIATLGSMATMALLGACANQQAAANPDQTALLNGRARLWPGMGEHTRPIRGASARAQTYFDQGLALTWGFNHDEAVRSFREVTRIHPDCAMGYWGMALALGPNINLPLDEAHGKAAYGAIQQAMARREHAGPAERDLIEALATRYQNPPPAERKALDEAYAAAMGKLYKKYPADDDIACLYAEALMDLSPWDYWTKEGEMKNRAADAIAALEHCMKLNINHPGANHLYIHVIEASPNPGRAEHCADRLGRLVPGVGHLVHMPSHIYVQVGRFNDSIRINKLASDLDREYFKKVGTQGIYHFYHAHNNHFLVWSAMFAGRYEDALRGCKTMLEDLPAPFHADPGSAEWLTSELHVHIRFGKWDKVLAAAAPMASQPYALANYHYARGMAFANTQRIAEARKEAELFEDCCRKVPKDMNIFIVPAHEVLDVARRMLAGETAFHEGKFDKAFTELRAAVKAEDKLRYSEPSPWMMPTRHALGALLLQRGKVEEAEKVYREDLAKHPGNGWALHGLAECLDRRNATEEAAATRKAFEAAWKDATVKIGASCFCRTGE